jgi:hypothetical protein
MRTMRDKLTNTRIALVAVLAGALLMTPALTAPASAAGPWWKLDAYSEPANLQPGGEGVIVVAANNLGDAPVNGVANPITISDVLPPGLTATEINSRLGSCSLATLSCTIEEEWRPFKFPGGEVLITVKVAPNAPSGGINRASISGGGVAPAVDSQPLTIGGAGAGFGVRRYEMTPTNEDGSLDTQAGSHPFQLTTTFALNGELRSPGAFAEHELVPSDATKDIEFDAPPGLVGNPTVIPQCTQAEFESHEIEGKGLGVANTCPANTAIGVAETTISLGAAPLTFSEPLYNLTPTVGEPARFAFYAYLVPVYLDTSVRVGGDYGVVVHVHNISQLARFFRSQVTIWGTPADPRHNLSRGWGCLDEGTFLSGGLPCASLGAQPLTPFLTLPTSCTGPFESTVLADSWQEPNTVRGGQSVLRDSSGDSVGVDGCNRLSFDPSISVAPNGKAASTPTGLTVHEHIPQEPTLNPEGLAEADAKSTTVTLPAGVQLSPSAADGLQACSEEEIGYKGFNHEEGLYEFTPGEPACPEASKVATVRVKTPLLPHELTGAAYLATQNTNPFGSLVALYVVAHDPYSGVLIKVVGEVTLNSVTGQVTTKFPDDPQLPYEELELEFFGTARAPLTTPSLCGSYTSQASLEPWSGSPPASLSSTFEIDSGPNGALCSNPQPFAPGFQAGSTNLQAGAFTQFTLTMGRPDADQTLAGLSVQLPPGLSGDLAKVPLCPEPQASTGECPEGSLIGHTVVSAGLGSSPFTVEGGKVFITGPYKGAPFGLSILNPAKAGPFDLGYVVVRAKVEVDPTTAALHIVSDPLPTIKDGIPLQIQHVNVTVDKPEFTFNPTNCSPMKLTGTMTSTEGASASVATPFQVTNCASLAFKPGFAVSTSGKPSRLDGTSLDVRLTYPNGAPGTLANIAKVKVELPKQLPSRLPTLQKACTEAVFNANPEGCPSASRVGEAVATTPILAGGLSGSAYFVSHGGAKFPELIVVLKGEDGVTVDLHGETFISKTGVTSSTFNTIPDVPVGSFQLNLPAGPYSALTAIGNPCKQKLVMPTEFVAQNGATIDQSTKIAVTGCPKAKRVTHKKKAKGKRHDKGKDKRNGKRG